MKFGKLLNIEEVNFSLPPTPLQTIEVLKHLKKDAEFKFYIGATGWGMKEWVGTVYPPKTKAKDFLSHYGRQFNTIELNTTHYRIPDAATVTKWKQSVPKDFLFCPKIPQSISHSRNLGVGSGQIEAFCNVISLLENNLGCCFIQLPPYFDVSRLPLLATFLQQFPDEFQLAVELRHESWFLDQDTLNPLIELLRKHQQHLVITDVAGRRDVLHMQLTSDLTMIRFVGNGLHPTDYQRIKNWVNRLEEWKASGLKTVYFFPHEPDNILAPDMAVFLLKELQEKIPDATVRGPSLKMDTYEGKQMDLFG